MYYAEEVKQQAAIYGNLNEIVKNNTESIFLFPQNFYI